MSGIVLQQAAILAVLGYVPGARGVRLPLRRRRRRHATAAAHDRRARALIVFALTLAMCAISGLLALRKVRRLDPAEVF